MPSDTKEQNSNNTAKEISPNVFCPFCKSNLTIPVDAKKALSEKSFYICLVYGQAFEYFRKDSR
jgi:hypothetical protein